MQKLAIVSLDLMVALPIVAASFLLILSSTKFSEAYLSDASMHQAALLGLYAKSQAAASVLSGGAVSYSSALMMAKSLSSEGIDSHLTSLQNTSFCNMWESVCRIVVVSGNAYLLVINYENASKP